MESGGPIEVKNTQTAKLMTVEEVQKLDLPSVLQKGLAFWVEGRGDGRFPSRGLVDPLQLREILSNVVFWEIVDAPRGREFVVRVAGDRATLGGSRRFKGYTLIDFHGDRFEPIWEEFDQVRRTGMLHYADRTAHWEDLPNGTFRRLLLPFGEGDTVTHLMSVIDFVESNAG